VLSTSYDNGKYFPRQKLNGAFLDGHAESLSYMQVTDPVALQVNPQTVSPPEARGALLWRRDLWLGIRRTTNPLSF
jgi:prepilin-type processing-associated H-X9-DG protein